MPQIPDGATIQIGLGALSNAIGYKLEQKKNLSVHTEMFTDSMMELVRKGVINGKMVAGFGLGSEELYNFIGEGKVELTPIRIVNDPRTIAKVDKIMSVNVTLMVDLTGQACSESLGYVQYSSTGGQADFVRGAALSNGGKSFLCASLNCESKGRESNFNDHCRVSPRRRGNHLTIGYHVCRHRVWHCRSVLQTRSGSG